VWGDTDEGRNILIAAARYLAAHSPTERAALQTSDIARRLMRGGELHQEAGASWSCVPRQVPPAVPTWAGFLDLAVVLDALSCRVDRDAYQPAAVLAAVKVKALRAADLKLSPLLPG
jgi:hypothetical protein